MVLFKGYGTGGSVTSYSVSIASQAYLTDNSIDILLADITVETSTCLLHTLEFPGLNLCTKTGCYEVLRSFSQFRNSLLKFMPRALSSRCVFCLLFTAHYM